MWLRRRSLSKNQGFSLIELTVVLVLISVVAGLIAPVTFRQLDKSKAKTEFLEFRNTLKAYTSKAFAQGLSIEINLDGNQFTARSILAEHSYQYQYLSLPKQTFTINHNGYPSIDAFTVELVGDTRQLTMLDMLGVKQEMIHAKSQ